MIPVQAEVAPGLFGHRLKQQLEMIGQIIRQVSMEDRRELRTSRASRVHPPAVVAAGGLAPWQERRAREMMHACLATRLTIADVARECRLTQSYFAKAFRRTTGMSPHKYLTDLRVQEAKSFLLSSTLPLAGIAIICGGTVNLRPKRQATRALRSGHPASAYEGSSCCLAPSGEGMIARSPILTGGKTMAVKLEVVVDPGMGGEELLGLPN